MINKKDAISKQRGNQEKNAKLHDGAEEACKNMADDSEYEDMFVWAGRCQGITRRTKNPLEGEDAKRGEMWEECWDAKKMKDSKPLAQPRLTHGESNASKPYGCYLSSDMKTLNYNRNTAGTTNCSLEFPCLCAQSNAYCNAKK